MTKVTFIFTLDQGITGCAASVDEHWLPLDGNNSGSAELGPGEHWLAWLVSGPSGKGFTVKATRGDGAVLFSEKRTISLGNTQHQGYKGFNL